ncbi:endolytic transglycosylase MltG [Enterococcus faecium]|uniref:endolytic transglycosylase MltG n=1 Tax=Enterococcus faecium TaxID=1352 RepID=UPI003872D891
MSGNKQHPSKDKKEASKAATADIIDKRRNLRKKEDKIVRKIILVIALTLLIIGGFLGFTVYRYVDSGLKPLDKSDDQLVQVEIPSGSSNKQIGEILEKDNIIKSGIVFNYYTKFKNLTGFQAGYYQLAPNMTLDEIGKQLQEGGTSEPTKVADGKIAIPEGYDIDQIAERVAKVTGKDKKEFLDLVNDETFFNELYQKFPELLESASKAENTKYRLEGYLFPATYDYYTSTSLKDLVIEMVNKTNTVMQNYYSDSPYNLYTNTGYGPGPFDNPSEEAIKAVLEPAENDYYYFVADTSTGNVYFAKTYEEHMELVQKYVNNS